TIKHPRELHRGIIQLKNAHNFHEEFKFQRINHRSLPIYQKLVDLALITNGLRFNCLVVDKKNVAIQKDKHTQIYNSYAGELIASSIDQTNHKDSEYITILADDLSTADSDRFEKIVSDKIKKAHRRNALFGICRLESDAVAEIQLCDVFIGTVVYAYKMEYGLASTKGSKAQFVRHLQKQLNILHLAEAQNRKLRNGVYFVINDKNDK
ncbi:MAG: hypothetical protein AAB834_01145, partial [Patescibacteria group bacterium]